ncbi:MAG: M48 family metallopeptidase [Oscillospiraceae bacterium]|nr:M48 family metallopeptidase [Oscillospiraceae bacterium]MBQ6801882.1 M48 family metallopeptidase [Oscillospiraceae bacterium]
MDYKLVRSKRKTIELSIGEDFVPLIKAPLKMSTQEIESFINKHKKWIEKQTITKREHDEKFLLSDEEERVLKIKALPYLTERTKYFADIMEVKYSGIKITSAKKRFGSCNEKNSICYSWHLMQYPPEAIDYVVVHELAHIIYKNHSKDFYKLIEKYLPDYKNREKLLK